MARDLRPAVARALVALALLGGAAAGAGCGGDDPTRGTDSRATDPVVARARAEIARRSRSLTGYAGPRRGPPAGGRPLVAFIAADLANGGIAGVARGLQEAVRAIGWRVTILDG
ncbi:MAG TPA: hypothetical protein VNT03_00875, partial [Baekduia sp.]|nr:hypothetical protein [Baekduia sp.]